MAYTNQVALLSAITATGVTTGNLIGVGDRKKLSIQFYGSAISSGNGAFTIQISNDGSVWTPYNRLTTNVTNTNGQTDLRAASVTINANNTTGGVGGAFVFIPDSDHFNYIRAIVNVSTDGSYYATLHSVGDY